MSLDFPKRADWLAVRSTPRKLPVRPMLAKKYAEGIVHFGSRAAYLEPTAAHSKRKERGLPLTRRRAVADPKNPARALLDEKGKVVMADFPIPEPWVRVTPKDPHPGRKRRSYAVEGEGA